MLGSGYPCGLHLNKLLVNDLKSKESVSWPPNQKNKTPISESNAAKHSGQDLACLKMHRTQNNNW